MIPSNLLVVCVVVTCGLLARGVSSWSFRPMQEPLLPTPTADYGLFNITFTCIADTPLTRCQVNEYDSSGQRYPLVDLSLGAGSFAVTEMRHLGNWIGVRYNGTGLEAGQCGAEFSKVYLQTQTFGCRGMDAAGEWHQMEFAPLYAKKTENKPASITPRQTVVQPGSDVSILLATDGGVLLPMCAVTSPFDPLRLIVSYLGMPTPCMDHYCSTHGRGMANGECGITLLNVTDADNGPLVILGLFAGASRNDAYQGVSRVVVASPPNATYYNVDKPKYSTGEKLRATCASVQSRPAANLTWTLDDRIIRQDARNDDHDDEWHWSWDKQTITQSMSLELGEEHFGKKLECRVQHMAMGDRPVQNNYVITKE